MNPPTLYQSSSLSSTLSTRALVARYAAVILAIAGLIIVGNIIAFSQSQQLDGVNELINVAGRQSMLSQRLSKEAYDVHLHTLGGEDPTLHLEHLEELLTRWQSIQPELRAGVDNYIQRIRDGFTAVEPPYRAMLNALECVRADYLNTASNCSQTIDEYLKIIAHESDSFVESMDSIVVNTNSAAAGAAKDQIGVTQTAIGVILLVLLGVVSFFTFRPAVQQIRATFKSLDEAQEQLNTANASLEQRVQERTLQLGRANVSLQTTNEDLLNFTSIITHDLRSPIAGIKGFLEEVQTDFASLKPVFEAGQRGQPDEHSREAFENYIRDALVSMQQAVEKAERLLRGIMDIAHERNRNYDMQPLDTHSAIQSVIGALAFEIQESSTEISLPANFPSVQADPLAFEQVMSNLIGNSIKYHNPARDTQIAISWTTQDDLVAIHVKDNGLGIPEEEQARVFQLFRRGSNADIVEGMGMGLYYVRNLARRHGGDITFTSKQGEGATFSVTLPLAANSPMKTYTTQEVEMVDHVRVLEPI